MRDTLTFLAGGQPLKISDAHWSSRCKSFEKNKLNIDITGTKHALKCQSKVVRLVILLLQYVSLYFKWFLARYHTMILSLVVVQLRFEGYPYFFCSGLWLTETESEYQS